ncbi:MAG TPA: hypothetical protein VM389_08915 [Phycisphaerae bacterium]|nr:hypothetical protein [Phycisphaerae bacterium]
MRRLLVTILIVGAFLGGYYFGRQPGSPDVFGWAQKNYPVVAEGFQHLTDSLSSEPAPAEPARLAVNSQTR